MKNISNILNNMDRRILAFIISFLTGDIAVVILSGMVIWVLFERLNSAYFSVITLVSLLATSILSKQYSYLLDRHSRIGAVIVSNGVMMALAIVTVLTDWIWLYAIAYFMIHLYFLIFYTARGAVAQALINSQQTTNQQKSVKPTTFKQLNSVLVITGKLGAIFSGMVIASLFALLSVNGLLALSIAILAISIILLKRFDEPLAVNKTIKVTTPKVTTPKVTTPKIDKLTMLTIKPIVKNADLSKEKQFNNSKGSQSYSYKWYFSYPLAWLVTLAIFIHVVIMLGNTIESIYLYEVLKISPEMVAYISVAFNLGALTAGVLVNFMHSEKLVIYYCFIIVLVTSLVLALIPTFTMFVIAYAIFGFTTSSNRVMFSSLIMHHLPNSQIATFFGLQSSLQRGLQFVGLLAINLLLFVDTKNASLTVWFYPAVYLLVPVVWLWMRYLLIEKDICDDTAPLDIQTTLNTQGTINSLNIHNTYNTYNAQKTKHLQKYFVEHQGIY